MVGTLLCGAIGPLVGGPALGAVGTKFGAAKGAPLELVVAMVMMVVLVSIKAFFPNYTSPEKVLKPLPRPSKIVILGNVY